MKSAETSTDSWKEECLYWWGRELTGGYQHYCPDWDFLPIDDTVIEFKYCTCNKEKL